MSKTQEKVQAKIAERDDYLKEQAESNWKNAQLKAALAKTELDLAVDTFKDLNTEMTEEQIKATEEQVQLQYARIEEFLMSEKDKYLERMGIQAD